LQYGFAKLLAASWTMLPERRSLKLAAPQRFYGITQTGFLDFAAFEEIVQNLPDGVSEVMCHPGYVDDDLKRTPTRLHAQRERELELLTSLEVRNLLNRHQITLGTYKDLLENDSREAKAVFPSWQGGVNVPNSREAAKPPLKGTEGVVGSTTEYRML